MPPPKKCKFVNMILTDTHSHLYDHKFAEDRADMIARVFEGNIQRIFIPNLDQYSVKKA